MITDLSSPLTIVWTSTGCMVAPIEIFPTVAPASEGRPRALANSFETSRFPAVMLSNRAFGVVIVVVSFDVKKDEPAFAVAHRKIERFAGGKFFDYQLLERRA